MEEMDEKPSERFVKLASFVVDAITSPSPDPAKLHSLRVDLQVLLTRLELSNPAIDAHIERMLAILSAALDHAEQVRRDGEAARAREEAARARAEAEAERRMSRRVTLVTVLVSVVSLAVSIAAVWVAHLGVRVQEETLQVQRNQSATASSAPLP